MQHLTAAQLDAYRARTLAPEALLDADGHLETCAVCRGQLMPSAAQLSALLSSTGNPHLTYEELEAYVDGRLTLAQRAPVITHLELCPQCQDEADDLARFRRDFNSAPSNKFSRNMYIASGISTIAAAALIAIGLQQATKPPDEYAGLVVRSLAAKAISGVPANVLALQGSGVSSLRGTSNPTFRLLSPVATAVVSTQPEFSWEAAAPGERYTVSIFDESDQRVDQSAPLAETRWTASKPLVTGGVYQWQVRSQSGTVSPGPSNPPAKFLVVDAGTAGKLLEAARKHPGDHLLQGILFAQAGVLDQAEAELSAAAPRGEALLSFVQALRKASGVHQPKP